MEAKLNHYSIDVPKEKEPQLKLHLNATAESGARRVLRIEDTEKRYLFSSSTLCPARQCPESQLSEAPKDSISEPD